MDYMRAVDRLSPLFNNLTKAQTSEFKKRVGWGSFEREVSWLRIPADQHQPPASRQSAVPAG